VPSAAEPAQDDVEQAVIRRVEEQPDVRDGDHRQHRRQKIRQTQRGTAGQPSIHRECISKARTTEAGMVAAGVDRVIAQGLPEDWVVAQIV